MNKLIRPAILLLAFLVGPALPAFAQSGNPAEEIFHIVNDYRYDPAGTGGDPDTGHSLCGTRCNAFSADYLNYMEPGGWEMVKVAENVEISVPLNNPFMKGKCICTADEYLLRIDDLSRVRR